MRDRRHSAGQATATARGARATPTRTNGSRYASNDHKLAGRGAAVGTGRPCRCRVGPGYVYELRREGFGGVVEEALGQRALVVPHFDIGLPREGPTADVDVAQLRSMGEQGHLDEDLYFKGPRPLLVIAKKGLGRCDLTEGEKSSLLTFPWVVSPRQ
jgi:hypothetical protein